MKTAKLSSKSQITIPAWARAALGIQAGDELVITVQDGHIVLERIETSIDELCGSLKGVYGDPHEYLRELRAGWDRDLWSELSKDTDASHSTPPR